MAARISSEDIEAILNLWSGGYTAGHIRQIVKRPSGQEYRTKTIESYIMAARDFGDPRAAPRKMHDTHISRLRKGIRHPKSNISRLHFDGPVLLNALAVYRETEWLQAKSYV